MVIRLWVVLRGFSKLKTAVVKLESTIKVSLLPGDKPATLQPSREYPDRIERANFVCVVPTSNNVQGFILATDTFKSEGEGDDGVRVESVCTRKQKFDRAVKSLMLDSQSCTLDRAVGPAGSS